MNDGRFTLALAQCKRPDDGNTLAGVTRWIERAADANADLVVFPEAIMTGFDGSVERFAEKAEPLDGPFAAAVDAIAAELGLWVVYTMNERNADGLPFNTAVVTDSSGVQRATYRKVHLFDAQGERESGHMAAGGTLMTPVESPFATIGLGICYDLRFPEVARAAALAGAQLMLFPAAWVAGPGKITQWKTLLGARAIENGMFVAGIGSVDEKRAGHSCVFAPDGTKLAEGGAGEELVTCEIDLAEVTRVRTATPTLEHRRPDCYRAVVEQL